MEAASLGLSEGMGQGSGHSGAGVEATRAHASDEYAPGVHRVVSPDFGGLGCGSYSFGGIGGLRLDDKGINFGRKQFDYITRHTSRRSRQFLDYSVYPRLCVGGIHETDCTTDHAGVRLAQPSIGIAKCPIEEKPTSPQASAMPVGSPR